MKSILKSLMVALSTVVILHLATAGFADDGNRERVETPTPTEQSDSQMTEDQALAGVREILGLLNTATQYAAKGENDKAIEDLTKAIDLGPETRAVFFHHIMRGDLYAEKGLYDRALHDYNIASIMDPTNYLSFLKRGYVHHLIGQNVEAIQDYNTAIVRQRDSADGYRGRANVYFSEGLYEEAIEDFSSAIERKPDDYEAYGYRAQSYTSIGDYRRAIADFNKLIESKPSDPALYLYRGVTHSLSNQMNLAVADYERCISTEEPSPQSNHEYAYLLLTIANGSSPKAKREDVIKRFREFVKAVPSKEWVRTISLFYLDRISEKDVLIEARKGRDDKEIKGRLCEAYYYFGEKMLRNNKRIAALNYFNKSVETEEYALLEYKVAAVRVAQLKGK